MPYRVTCPHCETALRVADEVGAAAVTCPRCLRLIPNPGPVIPGTARDAAMASAVEEEARRDSRNTGCGVFFLVCLVAAGIAFGLSFALSTFRQAGKYGNNLFYVWFAVGGLGGLLALCLSTYYTTRFLTRPMADEDESPGKRHPILGGLILVIALVTGLAAALLVLAVTCGAILGGGSLGGGL
jgi:predicted Zn finger-like uncharacterized protein